jgi:hypothetical protein
MPRRVSLLKLSVPLRWRPYIVYVEKRSVSWRPHRNCLDYYIVFKSTIAMNFVPYTRHHLLVILPPNSSISWHSRF